MKWLVPFTVKGAHEGRTFLCRHKKEVSRELWFALVTNILQKGHSVSK